MGLVVEENGAVSLGPKNKYRRMDSELDEDHDDDPLHHQGDASSSTRKYVFACAVFASLNSVLLGYGMPSSIAHSLLFSSYVDEFSGYFYHFCRLKCDLIGSRSI